MTPSSIRSGKRHGVMKWLRRLTSRWANSDRRHRTVVWWSWQDSYGSGQGQGQGRPVPWKITSDNSCVNNEFNNRLTKRLASWPCEQHQDSYDRDSSANCLPQYRLQWYHNQPTAQVYSLPSPCAQFTYIMHINYITKCFIAFQQFHGMMQMSVQTLQTIRILNGCFANTTVWMQATSIQHFMIWLCIWQPVQNCSQKVNDTLN